MAEDYYALLGVRRDASSEDLKRAYRQRANQCRVEDHKHRRRGADAKRQRPRREGAESAVLHDNSTAIRKVMPHGALPAA